MKNKIIIILSTLKLITESLVLVKKNPKDRCETTLQRKFPYTLQILTLI